MNVVARHVRRAEMASFNVIMFTVYISRLSLRLSLIFSRKFVKKDYKIVNLRLSSQLDFLEIIRPLSRRF